MSIQETLRLFTGNNPRFDLSQKITGQENWSGLDKDEALPDLKALQRVYRLYPTLNVATALMDKGYRSAHDIAAQPASSFIAEMSPFLAGALPEGITGNELASLLWSRARTVCFQVNLMAAGVQAKQVSEAEYLHNENLPGFHEGMPSWDMLFGPGYNAQVKECASIYGAAAYFTDLMRIINTYITTPSAATIPTGLHLKERRPDLWQIPLDCFSTYHELTYLEIANQVMAAKLSTDFQQDIAQYLATNYYPFSLPLNQPLEQIRMYLAHFGFTLADVYQRFQADTAAVARESLGLSIEKANMITATTIVAEETMYGLYSDETKSDLTSAAFFETKTSLLPTEVTSLVYQQLRPKQWTGVHFNGSTTSGTNKIHVLNSTSLQVTGSQTIEFWIYLADTPVLGGESDKTTIITKNHQGEFDIQIRADGDPAVIVLAYRCGNDTNTNYINIFDQMSLKTWYHVAVIRDMAPATPTLTTYSKDAAGNVVPADNHSFAAYPMSATTNDVYIARSADDGLSFNGMLAEIRIWNRALSHAEIDNNRWRSLSGKDRGLVAYWPLNEGRGHIMNDLSGHGNNGTLTSDLAALWQPADDFYFGDYEQNPGLQQQLWINEQGTGTAYLDLIGPDLSSKTGRQIKYSDNSDQWILLGRFIHLTRQSGWQFSDMDWALKSIGSDGLQETDISKLAAVSQLVKKLRQPVDAVCALWYDMKTYGMGAAGSSQHLFDRVFNTPKTFYNPNTLPDAAPYHPAYIYNPFYHDTAVSWAFTGADSTNADNGMIRSNLLGTLKLKDEALILILDYLQQQGMITGGTITIDVPNMSLLYRYASLPAWCGLPVDQFLQLLSLLGHPALDSPGKVLEICEWIQGMKKSGLTVYQFKYLCGNGTQSAQAFKKYLQPDVTAFLQQLAQAAASTMFSAASLAGAGILQAAAEDIFNALYNAGFCDNNGVVLEERPITAYAIYEVLAPLTGSAILDKNNFTTALGKLTTLSASEDIVIIRTYHVTNVLKHCRDIQTNLVLQQLAVLYKITAQQTSALLSATERQLPSAPEFGIVSDMQWSIPYKAAIHPGTVTLSFWVQFHSLENADGKQTLYSTINNGQGFELLYLQDDACFQLYLPDGTQVHLPGAIKTGEWCHVLLALGTATQYTWSLNGVNTSGSLATRFIPAAAGSTNIGFKPGNSHYLSGVILDFRLYDYYISDQQMIIQEMNTIEAAPGVAPYLRAWWRLNVRDNTTVYDWSDNGNDGTLVTTDGANNWQWHDYGVRQLLVAANADTNRQQDAYQILQRLTLMNAWAQWFKLSADEVVLIPLNPLPFGITAMRYGFRFSFSQLCSFVTYKTLHADYRLPGPVLLEYFSILDDADNKISTLANVMGWPKDQLSRLEEDFTYGTTPLNIQGQDTGFDTVNGVHALARCFEISTALGLNIAFFLELRKLSDLSLITGNTTTDDANWNTYVNVAEGLEHAINAAYTPEKVKAVLQPVQDNMQVILRDVMSNLLIWKLGQTLAGINTQQDLYEYLLIDVRMTNAVQMSVLKAGLNSLQLYVQRCLSNLENGVQCNLPKEWWVWMGNYREWEANRQVYVYPENYVDPALRKMQSPLFEALVSDVKQQPASEESVTRAYLKYLDGLKEISSLHIVDSYARPLPEAAGNESGNGRIVDVFARTLTSPVTFYHRKAVITDPTSDNVAWTPWEDLGLTINSDDVTPVYAFGKLFIFWVAQSQGSTTLGSTSYNYIKGTIYYSFQKAGRGWVTPLVLTDDIIIKTFNSSGRVTDYYYTFLLDGFNPMSEYERTIAWNKVSATLLPAAGDEEAKILITLGDLVSKISDTPYTATDKPATREQYKVYDHLKGISTLVLPHATEGKVTTVVPAFLLDAGLRVTPVTPLIDFNYDWYFNGALVTGDNCNRLGMFWVPGATALMADAGKPEPFIKNTIDNNVYHSWYNVTGSVHGSNVNTTGPTGKTISCLNFNGGYITVLLPGTKPPVHNEFTVGLWVQFNNLTDWQAIVDFSDYNGGNWKGCLLMVTNLDSTPQLTCRCNHNSGAKYADINLSLSGKTTGKWYYVALTKQPTQFQLRLYDPGTAEWITRLGTEANVTMGHNNMRLGSQWNGSINQHLFHGKITGLQVFNKEIVDQAFFDTIIGNNSTNKGLNNLPLLSSSIAPVKNQRGWFFLNAGKESFMGVPDITYEPVESIINVSYGQYLSVNVGTNNSPNIYGIPHYRMVRTSTNVVDDLLGKVAESGINALLQPSSQLLSEPDFTRYQPNETRVTSPYPLLDFNGAYGLYFWELFFHIPFYIAENLQLNLKFATAKKWYEYIFDPTTPSRPDTAKELLTGKFPATENLVACWPLATPSTGMMPSIMGTYDGLINGKISWSVEEDLPFSENKRGVSYFRGQQGYATVPYDPALNTKEFTVSFWMYFDVDLPETGGQEELMSTVVNNTGYRIARYRWTGQATTILVYVYDDKTGTNAHQAVYSMSPGQWYQVVLSVNATAYTFIINGPGTTYSRTQALVSAHAVNTSRDLLIGGSFNGCLANLSIWNKALSTDEINTLQDTLYIDLQLLATKRFWQFTPFRHLSRSSLYTELTDTSGAYLLYEYDPFDPDAIASQRPSSYAKGIFMRYISNLIDYGDNLFTQDTWESITEATMYYVLASDLLGRVPHQSSTEKKGQPATYNEIESSYGAALVPAFLIDLETAPSLSSLSATQHEALEQRWSIFSAYFGIPENKQLLTYRGTIEDRLYKIRHGLNINGQTNNIPLFQPPINPADAAAAAGPGGAGINSISSAAPVMPYYRFSYLVNVARNFTAEVIRLGNELTAALEKQDGEYLSLLRETQGNVIYTMMSQIKQGQVNELYAQKTNLQASLANAQLEQRTYNQWIDDSWNDYEISQLSRSVHAIGQMQISAIMTLTSSPMYLFPSIFGLAGGGMNFGGSFEAVGQAIRAESEVFNVIAGVLGMKGSFDRTNDQWKLQKNLAQNNITSINAQLQANDFAISVAEQDYDVNQTQIEQSNTVISFLQTKFTNEVLYEWIAAEVSSVYYQGYQLACGLAQMAQTAYQYEISKTDTYINTSSWSNQYKGLQAGNALMLSLNQLEQAYMQQNSRALEINRTISMARLNPSALMNLKTTGTCQFQLTEYLFDTDFPGHYNRKIENISITIPAIVGPYQNIKATLTQTSNAVIMKASTQAVSYLLGASLVMPADGSMRMNWNPGQAVALSTGTGDSGMFQLNFNDERYLPFENTGAVSSWQLDMPQAANQFDFNTINDVIIELKYTATNGGDTFKKQVIAITDGKGTAILQQYNGSQMLSLRQQYGDAWQQFLASQQMTVDLVRRMYPPNLASVSLVPAGNAQVTLIPVLSDTALMSDITSITLADIVWNNASAAGNISYEFDDAVSVDRGTPIQWPLVTSVKSGSALLTTNNTIDPKKWLDVILVIPFSGTLNWSS